MSQVLSSTFCWSDLERDAEIPSIEDSTKILLWENEYLTLCTQTFTEQEEVPLSSILTLCEGYMTRHEDDLEITHKTYQRTLVLWQNTGKAKPPHDASQRLRTANHASLAALQHNCEGRRFFSTTRGYTLGLAHQTRSQAMKYIIRMKPGRSICSAAPTLRSKSLATPIHHIHELMNLDETPEEVREEYEIIVINQTSRNDARGLATGYQVLHADV
jgi:hypothetical protein